MGIELAFEVIELDFIDFGLIPEGLVIAIQEMKKEIYHAPKRIKEEADKDISRYNDQPEFSFGIERTKYPTDDDLGDGIQNAE
jgi:hypothetical protein